MKEAIIFNEVNYLVTKSGEIGIQRLYGLLYVAQKYYLSHFARRIIDDFFILDSTYIIKPYMTDLKLTENFIVENSIVRSKNNVDFSYIAPQAIKVFDFILNEYTNTDKNLIDDLKNDSAIIKVNNLFDKDQDLRIISDFDIAKSGNCSEDVIKYINERNIMDKLLGGIQC